MGFHLVTLAVALDAARRLSEAASTGNPDCPCLTSAQRTAVKGWSRAKFENADGTTKVTLAGIDYSYPADYGTNACEAHDAGRQPYCSNADHHTHHSYSTPIHAPFPSVPRGAWCSARVPGSSAGAGDGHGRPRPSH